MPFIGRGSHQHTAFGPEIRQNIADIDLAHIMHGHRDAFRSDPFQGRAQGMFGIAIHGAKQGCDPNFGRGAIIFVTSVDKVR